MDATKYLGQVLAAGSNQRSQNIDVKLETAAKEKEEGNQHFAKEDNAKALFHYHRAMLNINGLTGLTGPETKKVQDLKVSVLNNMAAAYLRTGNHARAIEQCTKVLDIEAGNVKARFRRGKAFAADGNLDRAEEDMVKAEKLDPADKLIKKELAIVRQKQKTLEQKSKKFYSNMFDKMSKDETPIYDKKEGDEKKGDAAGDGAAKPAEFIDKDDYEPSAI